MQSRTAIEAYEAQLNDAQQQIKKLQNIIKKHQKDQKINNKNWGYVGDMTHINENLRDLINFFDNE